MFFLFQQELAYCMLIVDESSDVCSSYRLLATMSAVPTSFIPAFRNEYDVTLQPAWGITEPNPSGTVGGIVPAGLEGDEARLAAFARQGRFMFGVEMSVRGEAEREVPWDGASPGSLLARGPCVVPGS